MNKEILEQLQDVLSECDILRESIEEIREENMILRERMSRIKRKPDHMAESRRIQGELDQMMNMFSEEKPRRLRVKDKSKWMKKMMMIMMMAEAL